jgi:hypothetical protein
VMARAFSTSQNPFLDSFVVPTLQKAGSEN